ncbi:MAG: toxin [Patescibacteria group bacterium]|nr:toxin [Patescibacteria group bacterium]
MKEIRWNEEKNKWLKEERNVCFEDFVDDIKNKRYVAEVDNKNYLNQRKFFIEKNAYIYVIPYVENDHEFFLKTIMPSRKATKQYLK